MKHTLRLEPIINLTSLIGEGELVAFNVGSDGFTYFVIALRPLDYREDARSGEPTFAKTKPAKPQSYRVIALKEATPVFDVVIEGELFNIHEIQPLGREILLACGRSKYRGPDDFEKNGRVYSRDGKFLREFLLGDGIQQMQTTASGEIWTSYFDEGVFGNFGWHDPVGASGLVAWNSTGQKLYVFEPGDDLDTICDCYAMNVESDEDVWIYYYTEFPLVRIHRHKVHSHWAIPQEGCSAFAVHAGYALFHGGYDNRNACGLFLLGQKAKPQLIAEIELLDENGRTLNANDVVGRADMLYLISDNRLFQVDVQSAISG